MVLYYSATGNTRFIAELLAEALEDEAIDLLKRIKTEDAMPLRSEKPFIVCSPVYVCELPPFLMECIERTELTGSRELVFIFSDAGYGGMSEANAKKIARKKGMRWRGCTEIKMPTNNMVSTIYPPTEEEECVRRIENARVRIHEIAKSIKSGETLTMRHVYFLEKLLIMPVHFWWIRHMQPSKDFYVTEKCIGCGTCARLCPLNNVEMREKRPHWISGCAHCMACIGNCPEEAIEYRRMTENKKKYNIRQYLDRHEM